MVILSLRFVEFVLFTLAIYYLIPYLLPRVFQNIFLLGASYYFYFTWGGYYFLGILAVSALINFGLGHWLHKSTRFKKWILWLGIVLNAAGLIWFLVGGPYLKTLDLPMEIKFQLLPLIVIPAGISYYTLNNISYLIDINLRIAKPVTNLIDYALYLAYFPKLISGPLERARKFIPMLAEKRSVDNTVIAQSLTLILIGILRASILGGLFALFLPGKPLDDPARFGNLNLVWAMLTYMFWIYNNFAGYTDIVRGVSGLFGIPLTKNFAQPFFSKDFSDFWQRWHISLSQWLRDYIYMPISRAFLRRNPSRTNIPNLIIPPLVTMLASGLWHGTKPDLPIWGFFNFLIWGFFMGSLIVIENIRMLYKPAVPAKSIPVWRQIRTTLIFVGVMIVVTAPFIMDFKQMLTYFHQLALGWTWKPIDPRPLIVPVISLAVDWFQYKSGDEVVFLKWPVWLQVILIVSITMGAIIIQHLQSAPLPFVYP
jgi:D-alanyl-lipoteichoic acid acyltransferase DltB (MBOAT superfamily)